MALELQLKSRDVDSFQQACIEFSPGTGGCEKTKDCKQNLFLEEIYLSEALLKVFVHCKHRD